MNDLERAVYDDYPNRIRALTLQAAAIANMPLDHMVTAIEKMTVTMAHIGPHGTQKVEQETLAQHKELIEIAREFRTRYIQLALRASGRG